MARTTDEIIEEMDAEQANQSALAGLTSTSSTSIFKLWKYIVAQVQNLLEQLWDRKQAEIEEILASQVIPSNAWVRTKALEFQYDATTPQTIELVNMIPTYNPVDETKRIVTRCAVTTVGGVVAVLTAKNEPPEKLTVTEVAALQGYFINTGDGTNQAVGIGWGGQSIAVYSLDPDLLFLEATITYDGKYAGTIEDAVILAIEEFITDFGQNPVLRITNLVDALQDVPGFIDIEIENMSARAASEVWGTGTALVTAGEYLAITYDVHAGYMIGETTAGETFADKLTFTAV